MRKEIAKNCVRFSIVRYDDLIWMIETKQSKDTVLLVGPEEKGRIIDAGKIVQVIYTPAQLGVMFVNNPESVMEALLLPTEDPSDKRSVATDAQ